ncbi:MAG: hypothetical protein AAGD92_05545 [Pseudomonadota bacterium]
MLRNLLAIIVATIIGLSVAKFVEGAFGGGVAPEEVASAIDQLGLVVGWFVGSFIAAVLALLVGKRWAPLGWLAAGTIFFAAIITLVSFPLSFLLWPASAAATAAGGFAAIKLLNAQTSHPGSENKNGLFD